MNAVKALLAKTKQAHLKNVLGIPRPSVQQWVKIPLNVVLLELRPKILYAAKDLFAVKDQLVARINLHLEMGLL